MKEKEEKHESFKEMEREQKRELETREKIISEAHAEGERTKKEILRSYNLHFNHLMAGNRNLLSSRVNFRIHTNRITFHRIEAVYSSAIISRNMRARRGNTFCNFRYIIKKECYTVASVHTCINFQESYR